MICSVYTFELSILCYHSYRSEFFDIFFYHFKCSCTINSLKCRFVYHMLKKLNHPPLLKVLYLLGRASPLQKMERKQHLSQDMLISRKKCIVHKKGGCSCSKVRLKPKGLSSTLQGITCNLPARASKAS